ncbi:MAG TPA: PKD domain-containing protein, partial [Verrucomicrobiae bacterium]|nr:PKD domain-containing protein [Verrucomicrobiae bacterium]
MTRWTTPPADAETTTPGPAQASILDRFDDWTHRFLSAGTADRQALVVEGESLARQRRAALAALIETDPEEALRRAIPVRIRQELPPAVAQHLEERVNARGDLAVVAALSSNPETDGVPAVDRWVSVPGKTYRAFVYGRRLAQPTIEDIPVHGIALGGALAMHENPIRPLEPGETPDPTLPIRNASEDCPVSQQPSARAVVAQVGDEIVYFCTGSHIAALGEELIQQENDAVKPMASTWSQGTKTVLFIRAVFTDDTAESISDAGARTMMTNVSNWFAENSYYTTEMTATVTPLLTMPKTKEWYKTNNNYSALLTDARAVAKTNGYDTAGYNLDCVHFKSVFSGWSGRAYVGGKGAWLQSGNSVGVAAHEFGHNYGLWHANFWTAIGDTIIGPGSNAEYGNSFDTMGSASAGDKQFNAYEKNKLSWLPSTNVLTITNSGLYRVYAFDVPALTNNFKYALKVKKDTRDYWVELRRKFTSNKWIQNGVLLNWSPWASSAGGSHLLDTTPGSPAGTSSKDDAAIVVGRTFTDPFAGIHITPVGKNTTAPESMDVVVNLGLFPNNQRPVVNITADATAVAANTPVDFSAYATDADGDTLAYYWDFGDQSFGTNGPTASKSWSASGDYVVRCTASDMKGGTSSDAVVVRVGSP